MADCHVKGPRRERATSCANAPALSHGYVRLHVDQSRFTGYGDRMKAIVRSEFSRAPSARNSVPCGGTSGRAAADGPRREALAFSSPNTSRSRGDSVSI